MMDAPTTTPRSPHHAGPGELQDHCDLEAAQWRGRCHAESTREAERRQRLDAPRARQAATRRRRRPRGQGPRDHRRWASLLRGRRHGWLRRRRSGAPRAGQPGGPADRRPPAGLREAGDQRYPRLCHGFRCHPGPPPRYRRGGREHRHCGHSRERRPERRRRRSGDLAAPHGRKSRQVLLDDQGPSNRARGRADGARELRRTG